jgi:O-methyltransferase involved in polyketide biosynthesis
VSPEPTITTRHAAVSVAGWTPVPIDTEHPHPARRYDYWLGGKDNFAADRDSGDRIAEVFPSIRTAVRENRRFLHRVVAYLAAEAGIRQFIDIGAGIPTRPTVHDLAQAIDPTCRVAYVDNDPMVLAHARALMTSSLEGVTAYVQADLRDPEAILADPALTAAIDFTRPVAVLMIAVLHFLEDADRPEQVVARLLRALPAGSHLAVSHATLDPLPVEARARLRELAASGAGNGTFRFRGVTFGGRAAQRARGVTVGCRHQAREDQGDYVSYRRFGTIRRSSHGEW